MYIYIDERKTIRRYLVVGVIIMTIVGLACYDLWMRVERQFYSQVEGLEFSVWGFRG
jgi:hypothetical protein